VNASANYFQRNPLLEPSYLKMKPLLTSILLGLTCGIAMASDADLHVCPEKNAQAIFAGGVRTISVTWQNTGNQSIQAEIRVRLYQASAATTAPLRETTWKQLQILPGQTVEEAADIDFPAIRGKTNFLVEWLTSNRVLGITKVEAYPANLLRALAPVADDFNLGVFDPGNIIKPQLVAQGFACTDLGQTEPADFRGKLAIIGPFPSGTSSPSDLRGQIQAMAQNHVPVVWIQAQDDEDGKLVPSFYTVEKNQTAVVVAQPELVADFSHRPRSQLNLVHLCQLAQNPSPLLLPDPSTQLDSSP